MIRTFLSSFSEISQTDTLRLDFGIHYVGKVLNYNPFQITSEENYVLLSDVLEPIRSQKCRKGDLDNSIELIELENVEKKLNILTNVQYVNRVDSDKIIIEEGDIVIAKMTPRLGTMFLNPTHRKYLGSSELIEYKIIGDYNPQLLFSVLTSECFLKSLEFLESGKNQRRVNPSELLKLKIPIQNENLATRIVQSYSHIGELYSNIKNLYEIIDDVYKRFFNIGCNTNQTHFVRNLSDIGANGSLRFSTHYQKYFCSFDYQRLETDEWVNISKLFTIKGGKRLKKGDHPVNYESGYYYLRPTEMDIFGIRRDELIFISEETYNYLRNYSIQTNDFCVSIVGTLGKAALIDLETLNISNNHLILSENFAKLVPRNTINYKFYYYYFYSYIFKEQINREYTIRDQMKLGLDKLSKIQIPLINESKENDILVAIENECEQQNSNRYEIDSETSSVNEQIVSYIAALNKCSN